jgi:hypothetical protein
MEWVMSTNLKKVLGASLLTLAVVGGTATYLGNSLRAMPVKYSLDGYTTEISQQQPARHAEVIVTEGRAS